LSLCFVIAFLSCFLAIFTFNSWMLNMIVTDSKYSMMELILRRVCLCLLSIHITVFALGPM
jgi:hypothetical protein